MTEADVRNAAMSKETEDDFRKMTYFQRVFLFVSIARNMYSVCNLDFKTWKQQVSFHFESDTLSDHERTYVIKTEDTAECEEDARMGTKVDTDRGWERKDSDTEVDRVGDTFEDRTFDTYCDLREVIIRYLRVAKKSVSMLRSDLANITTILVRNLIERDKRVHKDKYEDSIIREEFVLLCLSTSSKTKARVRVRTKTKEFIGTAKNGHHNIGCSNDQQNSWTEAMLLERSTGLKIWQEYRLRVRHRKVQLEWRKTKVDRIKENGVRWRTSMKVTKKGSSALHMISSHSIDSHDHLISASWRTSRSCDGWGTWRSLKSPRVLRGMSRCGQKEVMVKIPRTSW